jgi:hypothetical protein
MEWLLSDVDRQDRCLEKLKFWVNAIIVHTSHSVGTSETVETAPVAFVGTRKDIVISPSDHERISTILYSNFHRSVIWPSVVEYDKATGANGLCTLSFFPIDNVLGSSDPACIALQTTIESIIEQSQYVNEMRPLSWLRVYDQMVATKRSSLSLVEVEGIAGACGVSANEVPLMLKLFHNMGSIMHRKYVTETYD